MEVSRQLQPYLPGLEPEHTVKQPHQMSPEEFLRSPGVVFHSTYAPVANQGRMSSQVNEPHEQEGWYSRKYWQNSTNRNVHVGTWRAASERALNKKDDDITMIAGHMTSPYAEKIFSDNEANFNEGHYDLSEDPRDYTKNRKPFIYLNKGEDPGALSAVLPDTTHLKTHMDYVDDAIKAGRGHEVHPVTMARYQAGNLSHWTQPSWYARQYRENDYIPEALPGMGDPKLDRTTREWKEDAPDLGFTADEVGIASPKHQLTEQADDYLVRSSRFDERTLNRKRLS